MVAPKVIRAFHNNYAIASLKIPTSYDPDHDSVKLMNGRCKVMFRRHHGTMAPGVICDIYFNNETIIHSAFDQYFEEKRRNVDEPV